MKKQLILIILAIFTASVFFVVGTKIYSYLSVEFNLGDDNTTAENDQLKIDIINNRTGGDITENAVLMEHIPKTNVTNQVIAASKNGTPMITFGNGENPKVMIVVGVHGNELSPQVAVMKLINDLQGKKIKGTIYIIPFVAPGSASMNTKRFEGINPSAVADVPGSPTNVIFNIAKKNKINFFAEFHSTIPRSSNPGITSVIYYPSRESFKIADYIKKHTGSITIEVTQYHGYLITLCNFNGIPSVICEVLSPDGEVVSGSADTSYKQMEAFLKYCNISIATK